MLVKAGRIYLNFKKTGEVSRELDDHVVGEIMAKWKGCFEIAAEPKMRSKRATAPSNKMAESPENK